MFDKTNASTYVELKSREIATKVISSSATAQLLISTNNAQFGIKTEAPVLVGDAEVILQSGSGCGRVAAGNIILADKMIQVKKLADKQDWCLDDIENLYFSYAAGAGSNPDAMPEADFIKYFTDLRINKVAGENEKLLWRGDNSLTGGTNNLKWFDGILKQTTAGAYNNINSSETDIVDKLIDAFLKNNVDVSAEDDFRVFMGKDVFNRYIAALKKRNIYQPIEDMNLFGTTGQIFVAPGLNGTSKVAMSKISNFRLGTDLVDEVERASFKYSIESEKYYSDIFYTLGVKVLFPEEVGLLDLNGSATTTTTTTLG